MNAFYPYQPHALRRQLSSLLAASALFILLLIFSPAPVAFALASALFLGFLLVFQAKIPGSFRLAANASSRQDAEKPAGEAAERTTLSFKTDHNNEQIHFKEIVLLQAENNSVTIYTVSSSYFANRSLRSIEEELDPSQFVRIHRATIINRAFIKTLHPLPGGDGYVELTTGDTLRYSRNYKNRLIN